jgi:nucleotide-binding universal stress UspA family protein
MSYKRIVVPVDGSSTATLGLKEALRLARSGGARLHLVHVVDAHYMTMAGAEAGVAVVDMLPALRKSGQRILDKALAIAEGQKVRATTALLETFTGPAASSIIREARRWRADLIVIGTHGRRGMRRALMGSDAEQVVRTSTVPVLLIRARGKAA